MEQNSTNKDEKPKHFLSAKLVKDSWQEVEKAKSITLLTHYRPDGDGISACSALEHIFKKMGKKVESIYPNKSEFDFKRDPKKLFINIHKQRPDLLIVLDTANYERFYYPKDFESIPIINIDHHISNQINGTYNFVEVDTSSTCEILYFFLEKAGKDLIDQYVAECLLFGILYDSQVFHTQSVYPQTLYAAAKLVEYGANLYDLKTELISNKNPRIIALWGKILSNIKITHSGRAVVACVTQKDLKKFKVKLSALIGFNNFLSQICGVDVTLFFYETDSGKTKVSLRSKKYDVNKLASKFGGGGHKNAAGILTDRPIRQLVKEIICLL